MFRCSNVFLQLEAISKPKVAHACVLEHGQKEVVGPHDHMISQARQDRSMSIMSSMLCHRDFHRVEESQKSNFLGHQIFPSLCGGSAENMFSSDACLNEHVCMCFCRIFHVACLHVCTPHATKGLDVFCNHHRIHDICMDMLEMMASVTSSVLLHPHHKGNNDGNTIAGGETRRQRQTAMGGVL